MKFTSDIVQKHAGLATSISEGLVIDNNNISETESHSAYYKHLPEGITKDTIKNVSKYNGEFVIAAHVAVAQLASDIMQKNKSVNNVQASVGFFGANDELNIQVERSKTFHHPLAKEGEPNEITKDLHMTTNINIKTPKAPLKQVKDAMSVEFKNSFKK